MKHIFLKRHNALFQACAALISLSLPRHAVRHNEADWTYDVSLLQVSTSISVASPSTALNHHCSANSTVQSVVRGHDMTGKVVLMTGGDKGIGFEIALALASQGATVIIANRNEERGVSAAANISDITGNSNVRAMHVDLASFNSTRALAAEVLARHDTLDVLINNAGISHAPPEQKVTEDGFEYVLQVNYVSHFLLQQLVLPALRQSSNGKIINVGSELSHHACWLAGKGPDCIDSLDLDAYARQEFQGSERSTNYGISKFFMVYDAMERSRREKVSGHRTHAYTINLGLTDTDMIQDLNPAVLAVLCSTAEEPCPMTASAGATPAAFLASAEIPADHDGATFSFCEPSTPPVWSESDEGQKMIFDLSVEWTSISSVGEA